MAIFKVQVAAAADTILPRDRYVNTIHFDRPLGMPSDPDQICADLNALFLASWYVSPREITSKLYAVGGPPPHFPEGEATSNPGVAPATNGVREVALCLSYYAERNLPRQRGRLYLPAVSAGLSTGATRPSVANMDKALTLADGLAAIGGADIDWGVYSPTTQQFRATTNCWVDDEWDIIRSRGLRPSTRRLRATGA